MAYPKDIQAKNERKKELELEKKNNQVTQYYYQSSKDTHYRKTSYASGRVITVDLSNKQ
jgi:hypothetical protein|tara:strand:+ start:5296 stop:5472 length:177 start_codon:yes stop_codon:yes gene_type:complete